MVKRFVMLSGLILVTATTLFGFNNCGEVGFQEAESKTGFEGLAIVEEEANEGESLSETEVEEIIAILPQEELEIIRPISDLESNPSLFETFKCPDSDGVVICHFPENVEAHGTKCIGRPAASTHYNHIRSFTHEGGSVTVGDYLGPCRFTLQ